VLSCAVLFDAAAATVAVCLLVLPDSLAVSEASSLTVWCPAWVAALTAIVLFVAQGWAAHRWDHLTRPLQFAGLSACGVVAIAAGWPNTISGPAGWTIWLAGLLVIAALFLQVRRGPRLLVFAAGCGASLLLPLAGRLPTTGAPSPYEQLQTAPLAAVRTLTLAGGGATLALTWMSANAALVLVLLGPMRRGSIRLAVSAAYRALALAVVLLALAALLGSWPLQFPRDAVLLTILAATAAMLHARFAGWIQDVWLAVSCSLLGVAGLCLSTVWLAGLGASSQTLGCLAVAALATVALLLHALHRYCFDCVETAT
jgi:hypothetical protein